jgi:TAP-like protein
VRRRYPRASLIATRGGTTHAHSLAGNACVDDRIAAYLAGGTLPARLPGNRPDVVCAVRARGGSVPEVTASL